MIKALLLLAIPVCILLTITVVSVLYARSQRRLVLSQENPALLLPRKERQQHARELLERQREQYELAHQQNLMDVINNNQGRK